MSDGFICTRGWNLHNVLDAINGFVGVWDINDNKDALKHLDVKVREKILSQRQESISSRQKISALVNTLSETESIETILSVLDKAGLSTIANCRFPARQICSTKTLPHSNFLQTFFFGLKYNLDNNNFIDKGRSLQELSGDIKQSFQGCRTNSELLKATGRFVVVKWLLIQHCNRDTNLIRRVLDDMRTSWPCGIDNSLCDIFYNSKMAVAAIMDGDISSALKTYRNAKCLSSPFQDLLISALLCHDGRCINQRVYMLCRSEENRRIIVYESENSIDLLSSDNIRCEYFTKLMKRMNLLYIAQHYLKMENDLRTDDRDHISENDLRKANNALVCFEKTMEAKYQTYHEIERLNSYMSKTIQNESKGTCIAQDKQGFQNVHEDKDLSDALSSNSSSAFEKAIKKKINQYLPEAVLDPRRAMIYFVCRARICEEREDYKLAELLLDRTEKLADRGADYTNEKHNIRTFIYRIRNPMVKTQCCHENAN